MSKMWANILIDITISVVLVKITSSQGLRACKFCRFMMIAQLLFDDAESDFSIVKINDAHMTLLLIQWTAVQ